MQSAFKSGVARSRMWKVLGVTGWLVPGLFLLFMGICMGLDTGIEASGAVGQLVVVGLLSVAIPAIEKKLGKDVFVAALARAAQMGGLR